MLYSLLAEAGMKRGIVLSAFVWGVLCVAAQQEHFDGKSWWHHIEILADDKMEGRGTGTPGLERAEAYVVDQLRKSGLASAGTSGYYQPIRFESRQVVEPDSSASLVRNGKAEALALGEDAFFVPLVDLAPKAEAPLVFLGYGINIPEKNCNDFAGLDLKGKVAVTMPGTPDGIDGPLAAHSVDISERWKNLRKAGLAGWIVIPRPEGNWSRSRRQAADESTNLAGDAFDETKGLQLVMYFNPAHAGKLFEGTGHTPEELFALSKDHKPLPRFNLPVRIRTTTRMLKTRLESANIVAKLEGSDLQLKNEHVVLSAHIDHLGIGSQVNGDSIYNGALDNASGCAALLDIASELRKEGVRPKRSILFVFFTAEEKGLLGSKYFTEKPPVGHSSIVADLNVDTIHAIVPLTEVAAVGMDESDLGDAARRAAASQSIGTDSSAALRPNGLTTGSDHASVTFRGIPAVVLKVGFPGEQVALLDKWRDYPYHTPFDDVHQPVNLETAAKFEEVLLQFLLNVANDPHRPQWKPTSFYKRYAAR